MLFALPGNPVAVMVVFLALVRPALLRMMGSAQVAPPLLQARSASALRKKPGRTEYQRCTVSTAADGTLQARTTGNQGSGVLSSMVQAQGLLVLPHAQVRDYYAARATRPDAWLRGMQKLQSRLDAGAAAAQDPTTPL